MFLYFIKHVIHMVFKNKRCKNYYIYTWIKYNFSKDILGVELFASQDKKSIYSSNHSNCDSHYGYLLHYWYLLMSPFLCEYAEILFSKTLYIEKNAMWVAIVSETQLEGMYVVYGLQLWMFLSKLPLAFHPQWYWRMLMFRKWSSRIEILQFDLYRVSKTIEDFGWARN